MIDEQRRPRFPAHFGSPELPPDFWARVAVEGECWVWQGSRNDDGYGFYPIERIRHGRRVLAHRFAYERLIGAIPEGLVLDHVRAWGCTSAACVNPAHLEPVSVRENVARSSSVFGENMRKTHCCRGHPFTPENTRYVRAGRRAGRRECRACDSRRSMEYQRRHGLRP